MDDKSKREQIEAISDEVGVLHPLLHTVFQALRGIHYVEYTHGPNEMGADFVLEKIDQELDTHQFIGVVAKTEKILQNFSDVERQIDECIVPRLIRQGKESAKLSEVWVITSKTISHNAKQKINEKFSTRTIHFFDCEWLFKRINEYAPHFWQQLSSAIGSYLATIDKRLSILSNQTHLPLGLSSAINIDLDIQEMDADRYARRGAQKKPRLVNFVEEVMSNKVTWLEAEMGFGKSFIARKVASHFSEATTFKETGVLPIFSSFKKFLDLWKNDLNGFITAEIGAECACDAKNEKLTFLLVLDGIDEASGDWDACKACLDDVISKVRERSDVKLLLTTRPLKLFEEGGVLVNSAKQYQIRPLSIAKTIAYLKKVLAEKQMPGKLLEDLGRSDLFKQLPQNPIAAALLGNLISQERYELPSNLTELYSKTIEMMMGRWDERKQISTEKLYKATERLARHLARHMIDNKLIYMSRSEIRGMFDAFLSERNIGVPLDDAFDYLLNRSKLFGVFPDTDAVFFKHRSFAEYLYARDAYEARNFNIDERAFHPYWINTFFFYVGSLGECSEVLGTLVSARPTDEAARFLRLTSMGNFLLAGYQTPYSVIQDSLDVMIVEAAKLYIDAREGRAFKAVGMFSEMQLLWVFATVVRQCYGYQFFAKGLPYALAKIDESLSMEEEVKIYSLFFASLALRDLNDNCGFEFLIGKRKVQELPMPISLAIRAEIEYGGGKFANGRVAKQFEKNLKKVLYTDEAGKLALAAKMDSLFKEPISTKIDAKKTIAGKRR